MSTKFEDTFVLVVFWIGMAILVIKILPHSENRTPESELRHLEDQIQRYYEIKREGGDPVAMFEDPGYDFDKHGSETYGMP